MILEKTEYPDEALWVKVSVREHLETILRNLIGNAMAYSGSGARIELKLRSSKKSVWIDVIDNGNGLTSDECEAIFAIGYRGKSSAGRSGLGIGLAQSRRVAESAGGTLEAYSDGLGKGATFTLMLPRTRTLGRASAKSRWALLVDDQVALTELYRKIVGTLDFDSETAQSVSEALDIIDERGMPSFVITDVDLGDPMD